MVKDENAWFTNMDEEGHESTYFCSDYKETPEKEQLSLQAGYNLRSRRAENQFPTSEDDRVATLDYTLLVKNFTALLEDFQVSQKRVKMRPIIIFFLFHFP